MNNKRPTDDDRLTEVESRLAHQERSSEEVSDVLAEQAREIDDLAKRVRRLSERVAALEDGEVVGLISDDGPPPHY